MNTEHLDFGVLTKDCALLARKNHAGTSPITRASGKKKAVMARYVHHYRLVDALSAQACTEGIAEHRTFPPGGPRRMKPSPDAD